MTSQKNDTRHKEVESINQRLVELERERDKLINRRDTLTKKTSHDNNHLTITVNQKIDLFKNLFKGRTDIFASRWQNAQGRNGYSVACHNEWVKGICNKPKIKCNDCSHRKFKALDEKIIYRASLLIACVLWLCSLFRIKACF